MTDLYDVVVRDHFLHGVDHVVCDEKVLFDLFEGLELVWDLPFGVRFEVAGDDDGEFLM